MDKYKTAEATRRLAKVVVASDDFGRPLIFPPGVPADRVKIMRDAFNKAIRLGMEDFPQVHLKRSEAYAKLKDFDTAIAQHTEFLTKFGLEESCRL